MKFKKRMLLVLFLLVLVACAFPAHAKGKRKLAMTVDGVQTALESYNPYYGEKMRIATDFTITNAKSNDRFKLTVAIKMAGGKTIFKKTKTYTGKKVLSKNGKVRASFKWKGKASKGNAAKLKKDMVAPVGDYVVTATLKCTRAQKAKKPKKASASCTFSVNNTEISYTPVSAKVVPKYTGTAEIDYVAELMLKEAGVKPDMPEELRVRLIYNYVTVNFKHLQDTSKVKPAFNLTALASEIAAYKKETKKKAAAGAITITSKWSGELNHFVKRAGTCNNNAAAFVILCNHVGIKCKRVHGKVYNGPTKTMNHYWNKAVVDGVTWYYDPDVEIHHYKGNGVSSFSQYRKTLEQCKKSHIFD